MPRFVTLAKPYWYSEDKWKARSLLALLAILLLGNTAFSVYLNEQAGEFTSALAAQDSGRYWSSIYKTVGLIATAAPLYVFYYFVRDKLVNYWRRWLTHNYLDTYFRNNAFYKLAFNAEIDNPDQRIAEDINTFTLRSIYYFLLAIETFLQLIAFSGVLWSISRTLVLFLVVYASVGTLVASFVFGRSLVALNFFQLKREADFRFSLVRVRENAESIAFYRGEEPESRNIKQRFGEVFQNYNKIINWQWFLNLFQYSYSSVTLILPGIILSPQVLSGDIEVGRVVQAAGAFAAIFAALTVIVNNFDTLSRFAAGISRLDKFAKSLEMSSQDHPEKKEVIKTIEKDRLAITGLSLQTPDYKRTLIVDLSLEINPSEGVLIIGASGGGKSSLLRASSKRLTSKIYLSGLVDWKRKRIGGKSFRLVNNNASPLHAHCLPSHDSSSWTKPPAHWIRKTKTCCIKSYWNRGRPLSVLATASIFSSTMFMSWNLEAMEAGR